MTNPVQEQAEIFSIQRVGDYFQFTLVAPQIAKAAQPGHFVAVAVGGENSAMLLRRSFALYSATPGSATPGGEFAGTIQFVVAEHGPGTRWLTHRRAGDVIDVVGPLGTPFPLPSGPSPAVLVGGGYGTAPLIPLAQALLANGSPVEIIVGAATAGRLFGEIVAKRLVGAVTVTTDDGSAGRRGLVTDVLPEAIDRVNAEVVYACGPMPMLRAVTDVLPEAIDRVNAEVVYACGPMPMLRAVGDIARAHSIKAQVAVEEAMACGIGVCMTCVLPVRGEDGRSRFVRSCVEGPVFDADRVRWADVGTLPPDLVGADAMGGGH